MTTKTQPWLGWYRVSTSQQEDVGFSLPAQRAHGEETARRNGGKIAKVFEVSESGMDEKCRPQFEALLVAIGSGRFQAVVARSLDRLSRTVIDQQRLFKTLVKAKVGLFVNGARFDFRNSGQKIGAGVAALVGEEQTKDRHRDSLVSRIDQAINKQLMTGEMPFGRHPRVVLQGVHAVPVLDAAGDVVWDVDKEKRDYMKRVAALKVKGVSYERIVERVGAAPGDRPSTKDNLGRQANTLRRRLLHPAVSGVWKQNFTLRDIDPSLDLAKVAHPERLRIEGDRAVVTCQIPPLLDEATIAKIRAGTEDRYVNRVTPYPKASLSGFLRCAACGSALDVRHYQDGAVRLSHNMRTRRGSCPRQMGHYKLLHLTVLGTLSALLRDEKQIGAAVRQAFASAVPDAAELRAELAAVNRALRSDQDKLSNARHNLVSVKLDAEDADRMSRDISALKASIASRQAKVNGIEERLVEAQMQPEHEEAITATLHKFKGGHSLVQSPLAQQRQALKAMFGGGSLRNRPAGQPQVAQGIFVSVAEEHGQRFLHWRAVGRFFIVEGEATWEPRDWDSTWAPEAEDITAVVGALKTYASQRGSRRWSASACHGTSPPT
ncbi:MAG: recombinase family protein [Burkholderiales bacterium]